MGSRKSGSLSYQNEIPQRTVEMSTYWFARDSFDQPDLAQVRGREFLPLRRPRLSSSLAWRASWSPRIGTPCDSTSPTKMHKPFVTFMGLLSPQKPNGRKPREEPKAKSGLGEIKNLMPACAISLAPIFTPPHPSTPFWKGPAPTAFSIVAEMSGNGARMVGISIGSKKWEMLPKIRTFSSTPTLLARFEEDVFGTTVVVFVAPSVSTPANAADTSAYVSVPPVPPEPKSS